MKKIFVFIFAAAFACLLILPAAAMPDWYPEDVTEFEDFHGTDLARVADFADIFTSSEEAEFTASANALIDKYGFDFVIFTDTSIHGIAEKTYPADFYRFNGYGKGSDYSGSVFFICMEPGNNYWWSAGTGRAERYFTEHNINVLDDRIEPYMADHDFAGAVRVYIESLAELYETGELAEPVHKAGAGEYVFAGGLSSIVGLIAGAISSNKEKSKMFAVRQATYANDYIVSNSFAMKDLRDMFLYKDVTRTIIESSSSGSGRSGGSSSYSSGYHSSGGGGGSFSGGGRHF